MIQMNLSGKQKWTDLENKCMDPKVGKEGGMNCKIGIDVYTVII